MYLSTILLGTVGEKQCCYGSLMQCTKTAQVRGSVPMLDHGRVEVPPSELSTLQVGFSQVESSCVLTLCGELTGSSIPALEAQIDQIGCAACEYVVLDVSSLTAIDSVGMHVLVGLDAYVHGLGARLTVAGARGQVAEALATASLGLVDDVWARAVHRQPLMHSAVLVDEGIPL